ncbi:uncharacterized protein LOC118803688 [Colossoma macropomum]|uniref:uncharacterized protein LOC118803688 n=1 Tax=Colossoma macropomum TaxID=42526 RepID=UPI0018656554|nr:uncharacterized protein LOC118803688 [Colossoma macropomum]
MSKPCITDQSLLDMIDNFDRPGGAYADGPYADADTYADGFTNKPGKRLPKAGAVAQAGVARAGAQWRIFQAEAKGPNASAGAEAKGLEAGAMARAEIGSAAASAGPVGVKVGLGVDTGVKISPTKAEVKFLGYHLAFNFSKRPLQPAKKAGSLPLSLDHHLFCPISKMSSSGPGRARAEQSIFEVETKGPSASASAEANGLEVGAMARAEVGSASASVGPVGVKVGLGVDTGVKVGPSNVEAKFLGTGVTVGRTVGISLFGNELSFNLW